MIELELKDIGSKHRADARNLEMQLAAMKDSESDLLQKIDMLTRDNQDLQDKVVQMQDEREETLAEDQPDAEAMSKLQKLLDTEQMLKQQAVNKLAEIMARKDFKPPTKKATSAELRKKEKECRKLQQDLNAEKEKFDEMCAKLQKDLQDLQATLYEESQKSLKLSMELDTKESELENVQLKLAHINLDTASLNSGLGGLGDPFLGSDGNLDTMESNMEGWLQVPSKQNIRRHGWKKLYVIVSSKKIIFFNSEAERQNADPTLILDLNKVFHVRSVTQGDVIRAEAKDIPRIFQILYAGEGESRKPEPNVGDDSIASIVSSSGNVVMSKADKSAGVVMKGHDFVQISYHMPASCDSCAKPLWAPFRPPPALECRLCRAKFHKEHVIPDKSNLMSGSEGGVAPCKVSYDPTTAKDMLIMAPTSEEQKIWVARLAKKIQKSGFKASMMTGSTSMTSNF